MVGTRQPSIARLENGTSVPSLSFLDRIAKALDARIELNFVTRI
jgi:transcriptional regulator with XRE-family HTH domain